MAAELLYSIWRGIAASSGPRKRPHSSPRGRLQGYVNERLAERFKAEAVFAERNRTGFLIWCN